MTTPGGVPNLPAGALTLDTMASKLQDMSGTAMKARAVERFPSIMDTSTGLSPASDLTPFGILTTIWSAVNSLIANADPADINSPDDLPELVLDFIEGLPVVGTFVGVLEAILGTYDGDDQALLTVQEIFAPIRKLLQLITGLDSGFPTLEELTAGWANIPIIGDIVKALTGATGGFNLLSPLTGLFGGILDPLNGTFSSTGDQVVDNGDGTWNFIADGINHLIFNGDGTVMSPASLIENFTSIVGTFQGLLNQLFDQGTVQPTVAPGALPDITTDMSTDLLNVVTNLQSTWDQIFSAISNQTGSGTPLATVSNVVQDLALSASSALQQAISSFNILGIRNNRPGYTGLERTAEAAFHLTSMTGDDPPAAVAVTSSSAPMGLLRVAGSDSKGFVQWLGHGNASITGFFVNVYKMNQVTGDLVLLHTSPDMHTDLPAAGSWTWLTYTFAGTDQTPVVAGDVLAAEFVVAGAGTHTIAGIPLGWLPAHPTAQLQSLSAARNPAALGASPVLIPAAAVGWTAITAVPWVGFGITNLPANYRPPESTEFNTDGSYTYTPPAWFGDRDTLDVIMLGAGGGGGGSVGWGFGNGGSPGVWFAQSLVCGVDFPRGSLQVTVGSAGPGGGYGAAGGTGGPSTVVWNNGVSNQTWSADSGAGGGPFGGSSPYGLNGGSPGNRTYNGVTYFGGQIAATNSAGDTPGGGGGGAPSWFVGAPGADGSVWIVARRTATTTTSTEGGGTETPPPPPPPPPPPATDGGFVTRDGATGNLMLNGQRFRFSGGNVGNDIGTVGAENGNSYGGTVVSGIYLTTHAQIDAVLDSAQAMNATVLRSLMAVHYTGHPLSVQPTLGSFNAAALEPLDYALQQCALRGMKLIIPLVDEYSSKPWYVANTGGGANSNFHTRSSTIDAFKAHISFVLDHVNVHDLIPLKSHPAVLCWETGNELTTSGATTAQFATWIDTISQHIKVTKSAQQLVMDGGYGTTGDWVTYATDRLSLTYVDLYSNHSYDNYRSPANMVAESNAAHSFGKAFVLGEYTWTGSGFAPQPTWTLEQMLDAIEESNIDGDCFWDLLAPLTIWNDGFTLHYPGDNANMITRGNTLAAHALVMTPPPPPAVFVTGPGAVLTLTGGSAPYGGGDFTGAGSGSLSGGDFTGTGADALRGGTL